MEEPSDSFNRSSFSAMKSQSVFNRELNLETNTSTDDNIDELLSQLTDNVSQQPPKNLVSSQDVGNTPNVNEGGVELQDPPNVDEILTVYEGLITPTSHNVSIINSACQQVLKEIERQLLILLKKNRKEQEIVQSYLVTNDKGSYFENTKKTFLKCAGMPYFKDGHGFQPPPNKDVLRKQKEKKLLPIDFIKGFPIWNNRDAKTLINAVNNYDAQELESIDWMKISVTEMEGKYSPSECKSKWLMNLNPSINRSRWTLREMELLKALSGEHNYQNWDLIASQLGTNRTGLQCCIQYMTNTFPTQGKWTKEEDEALKNLVEKFRVKDYIPWKKVVWHFETRSQKQCQERYAYHLGDIKKGNFTKEEDFLIVYLAPKLKNFGQVAKFLPNRVATQVRARYEYLVELSMPQFSKEEDELLSKLMAQYPRDWGTISSHFTNRSRIQCRRRWGYLQRKIKLADDIQSESENDEICDSPQGNKKNTKNSKIDAVNFYKRSKNVQLKLKPSQNDKQYSQAYNNLLIYHRNCHKFLFGPKPRISLNPEDQEKLIKKMRATMKILSVGQMGPLSGFNTDSLSNLCEFDKEDLDVLSGLQCSETTEFEISKKIIPPNYMNLVGVRSLMLNFTKIKNLSNFYKESPPSSSSSFSSSSSAKEITSSDRLLCSDAKQLFKSRLKTLFAFPLILSNITPINPKSSFKPKTRKAVKPLSKHKRKEHAKLMYEAYREKLKMLNEKLSESDDMEFSEKSDSTNSNCNKNNKRAKQTNVKRKTDTKEKKINESEPSKKRASTNKNAVTPLKKKKGTDS